MANKFLSLNNLALDTAPSRMFPKPRLLPRGTTSQNPLRLTSVNRLSLYGCCMVTMKTTFVGVFSHPTTRLARASIYIMISFHGGDVEFNLMHIYFHTVQNTALKNAYNVKSEQISGLYSQREGTILL